MQSGTGAAPVSPMFQRRQTGTPPASEDCLFLKFALFVHFKLAFFLTFSILIVYMFPELYRHPKSLYQS